MGHHIKHNFFCWLLTAVFAVSTAAGLSGISVNADEFEDVSSEYQYSTAINVLGALGILTGMEDGNFYPDNNVTRAEFVTIIIRAMKMESIAQAAADQSSFADAEGHWAQGYISLALQNGYVSGMSETEFCPDEQITFEQAVKVMVCITGFQAIAEQNGGYPSGYIRVANENDITKNIMLPNGTAMNRGQIAQLLFDTMNADMIKSNGYTGAGQTLQRGGTLMDEFSDYADERGIIASVGSTSIDRQSGTNNNDYVVIRMSDGELRVNVGETNAAELLGCEVRFYTNTSDINDYTLLYIEPTINNRTITLGSEELGAAEPYVSYSYYDGGRLRTLNLDSNASYIYNGEYTEELTETELVPKDGTVRLLDNDSDGRYEIVFIDAFQHLIVSDYRVSDGVPKLYFRPNPNISLGQLEMDPNDRGKIINIYRDGELIVPDENTVIEEWTVASVAQSKSNNTVTVYLSDESVSGTIDSISSDDNGDQYLIDGAEYYTTDTFDDNVSLGEYHTFLISFNGRIAGINPESSVISGDYALVMYTSYDTNEYTGYIKLLHADGTMQVHATTDDLIINDTRVTNMSESALRVIETYSLIKFAEDSDGKIYKVDTANNSNVCTTTNGYIDYNEDNEFSLNASTNLYFNDVDPPTLGGDMKLDSNTIVFDISSDDENEWGTGDYKLFNDDTIYAVDAYDLDEFKIAGAVVNHGPTVEEMQTVTWSQSPLLIEKISLAINDNGDETYSVTGMQDGERVTIMARDKDITDDEGTNRLADMTSGSVIQVRTNLRGEITKIRKLYKAPSNDTVYDIMESRDWNGSDYNVSLHTVYGMCMNANENILTVATRMNDQCRAYSITGANIYIYRSAAKTAELGSIYDIKPGSSYGYDECSRVFLRMEKDTVRDIVIYED